MEDYASMTDESLVVACLAMVVIGSLPFLYMFDDKADHSEGGFKRYIWKSLKEAFIDAFFPKKDETKPSEEKPSSTESDQQDSSLKEEQPA